LQGKNFCVESFEINDEVEEEGEHVNKLMEVIEEVKA
jgi:hypothetical protein